MRSLTKHLKSKNAQLWRHNIRTNSTKITTSSSSKSNILTVKNPYSGDTHCEIELSNYENIQSMLETCVSTQKEWWLDTGSTIGLVERQNLCNQFLSEFEKHSELIANDITAMMGKPLQQSRNEIATMMERAETMIDISTQFLSDQPVPPQIGFDRRIRKEPKGTILIISPWNYPLLCTINSLIPALLCGNSVILKLSSKTPLIANHFVNILEAAGFPSGLVVPLHCDHQTTTKVIEDHRVSGVVFTGSVAGGYDVQNATSKRLIDATLELGGKDPAYIARDADLKYAVESVVDGAMYNAGQSCCGIERVYVHKDLYSDFIQMAADLISNEYVIGDPMYEHPKDIDKRKKLEGIETESESNKVYDDDLAPTTNIGPMAQESAIDFLSKQVNDAMEKGANLIVGDNKGTADKDGKGRFFKPTLLTDCNHSMSVMKEESFGPILPVQSVEDDKEAIDLMNDSEFGLTAAVFTKDKMKMERMFAPQIQSGTVFMNRCDYLDPYLPWTGRKETGKGVSLSPFGFNNFMNLKSLHFKLKT